MAGPILSSPCTRTLRAVRRARRATTRTSGQAGSREGARSCPAQGASPRARAAPPGPSAGAGEAARAPPLRLAAQPPPAREPRRRPLRRPRRGLRRRGYAVRERVGLPRERRVHGGVWQQRGHHVDDGHDVCGREHAPEPAAPPGLEGPRAAAGGYVAPGRERRGGQGEDGPAAEHSRETALAPEEPQHKHSQAAEARRRRQTRVLRELSREVRRLQTGAFAVFCASLGCKRVC